MKVIKSLMLYISLILICLYSLTFAQEVKREAKIISIEGMARVKAMHTKLWIPAEIGMILREGDMLKTGPDAWVMLNLNGSGQTATVEVESNSQLYFTELIKDEQVKSQKTLLELAMGEILITVQKADSPESSFEVKTPTAIVGVRGTKFAVKVEALD